MRTARWQDSPKAFPVLLATAYQGAMSRLRGARNASACCVQRAAIRWLEETDRSEIARVA